MIVEVDGLRSVVQVRESRAGPDAPVTVLMASMLIRPRSYTRLVQRLSKTFRVVTIEPPGSGEASKVDPPWTFGEYADHLARMLEKLDLRDVTLIGHSNSGGVALIAAAPQHPASRRIARIVLADSVGLDPRHGFWRIGLGRLLDGFFEFAFSITALYDVFWNLIAHNRNFLKEIEQAIAWDATPHAPKVRLRTLIAWGRRDITFLPWCARRLHEMIPHAKLYFSPTGHHDWLETNPAEFAAAVERFAFDPARQMV